MIKAPEEQVLVDIITAQLVIRMQTIMGAVPSDGSSVFAAMWQFLEEEGYGDSLRDEPVDGPQIALAFSNAYIGRCERILDAVADKIAALRYVNPDG